MRRSTRTSLTALLVAVLAFAAGCGGSEVASEEVPGPPAALTVPSDSDLGGSSAADNSGSGSTGDSGSNADNGTADSGTADPTATPTPPADTSGGAAAPEATPAPDTATSDTPPAAGSPPEQFEDFCAQNAGAC
jgi:hypothetical protein